VTFERERTSCDPDLILVDLQMPEADGFTLAETIEWISQFLTLEPGDLIATGTPSGVGSTTQTYLKAGDVVEVEVEKLGVLRNKVVPPRD